MAHFGIDLPTPEADRFDTAFWSFVGAELSQTPEVETRLHSFQVHAALHRRVVEISDPVKLKDFAAYWRNVSIP